MHDKDKLNGDASCPISHLFQAYLKKANVSMMQIETLYSINTAMLEYMKHLEKLDCLERIEDKLIGPATNENRWDGKVVWLNIKILGLVIVALVFCIVFLITGQSLGWLNLPGKG